MASVFDTIKQTDGQGNKSLNWYRNVVNRLVGKTSAYNCLDKAHLIQDLRQNRLNLF